MLLEPSDATLCEALLRSVEPESVNVLLRKRNFDECPELPALFVGVMKNRRRLTFARPGLRSYDLENNVQRTTGRINEYVNKHPKQDPSPPGAPGYRGENLSGVPGRGRNGKVASTQRIHRQGSSPGCESRWHLPDVVHQFHHRQEPLLRRRGTKGSRLKDSSDASF
jgi:hypothetical protein